MEQDLYCDYWDVVYSGAPDECGWHFRNGNIVKFNEQGECPLQLEHPEF